MHPRIVTDLGARPSVFPSEETGYCQDPGTGYWGRIVTLPSCFWLQLVRTTYADCFGVRIRFRGRGTDRLYFLGAGQPLPVPPPEGGGQEWYENNPSRGSHVICEVYPEVVGAPADHACQYTAALVGVQWLDGRDKWPEAIDAFAEGAGWVWTQTAGLTTVNNIVADFATKDVPGLNAVPATGMRWAVLECLAPDGADDTHSYVVSVAHVGATGTQHPLPLLFVPNYSSVAGTTQRNHAVAFPLPQHSGYLRVRAWKSNDAQATSVAGMRLTMFPRRVANHGSTAGHGSGTAEQVAITVYNGLCTAPNIDDMTYFMGAVANYDAVRTITWRAYIGWLLGAPSEEHYMNILPQSGGLGPGAVASLSWPSAAGGGRGGDCSWMTVTSAGGAASRVSGSLRWVRG
jgi:hypothetical protein